MRIASQFVAFWIVLVFLAGPCLVASTAQAANKQPSENGNAFAFVSPEVAVSSNLIQVLKVSKPCTDDCEKKQCTKAVINRVVTQVRFVLLPISDVPFAFAPQKMRLRDRKLSNLFAKNTQPCNRSVDLFALCRQLN